MVRIPAKAGDSDGGFKYSFANPDEIKKFSIAFEIGYGLF